MEYVYDHLHEKLMVSDIAEELGLSVQYLSKLFRTETGLTLNRYILKKKIDAACQMLKYSQYEAVDVGNFLAFSSHSHFIQKFREETRAYAEAVPRKVLPFVLWNESRRGN